MRRLLTVTVLLLLGTFSVLSQQATYAATTTTPSITRQVDAQGVVTYSTGLLHPDGQQHQLRYNILCANGAPGCYNLFTFKASYGAGKASTTHPNVIHPNTDTEIQLTNDYYTCTGSFGTCGDYTEAYLWADDYYTGTQAENYSMQPACGASNWTCSTPLAGTFNDYNQCNGCIQNNYGPQAYNQSSGGGSQTKYSKILLHPDGTYQLQYRCIGSLC